MLTGRRMGPNRPGEYPIHEFGSGEAEVYSVRPDGTDLQQLTSLGVGSGAPSWTPDGAHIFFWGYQTFYPWIPMAVMRRRSIAPGSASMKAATGFTALFSQHRRSPAGPMSALAQGRITTTSMGSWRPRTSRFRRSSPLVL